MTEPRLSVTDVAAEALLADLVTITSFTGQEDAAVAFLVQWLRAAGYEQAFIDEAGNAVGIMGQGDQTVVLLGHIDTFPGELPVFRQERKLYGRGAVDAKGPLCTFAAAGARANLPDNVRLVVIGAVEEEGSSRGARYVVQQYQPAACIIGEPSQWDRMTLGYKGRLLLDWHWQGPLAHSAGQALSPGERAIAYWQQVLDYTNEFNADKEAVFARLDATLQAINTQESGAFGSAALTAGFRLPPSLTPGMIETALQTNSGAKVSARGHEQAFVGDRDNALTRAMRGAIRATGGTPRFVHKTGTSDMNVVGPVWQCPIIAYGPGDSALDHTPEEHIDLDEYLRAVHVLTAALERLQV
jgi:[amino group carrier protein]-lysine/ornithine hydrolase